MTKKSIFKSATTKIRATAARNISRARAEMAHEMKRIYWRDLYKRMHKISYREDEVGIAGFRYMRILSLAVQKGANRHLDRMADKIRNALFEAIYEAGYAAEIKDYKYRGRKWRMAFAADLTMRIHKKIAKTPAQKQAVKSVDILPFRPCDINKSLRKIPKSKYFDTMGQIAYTELGLSQNLAGLMGTIAYEYTRAMQSVQESELPGALIKFTAARPLTTRFMPKKRQINKIEIEGVGARVEKDFDERLTQYLAQRGAHDQ